eukprot:gene18958-9386_t
MLKMLKFLTLATILVLSLAFIVEGFGPGCPSNCSPGGCNMGTAAVCSGKCIAAKTKFCGCFANQCCCADGSKINLTANWTDDAAGGVVGTN